MTLLETMAGSLGPGGEPLRLRWVDPEGESQVSTALVLVSNNPYRLGATLGSGTRPRLDSGLLGLVDFHPPIAGSERGGARWRELSVTALEIDADGPVPVAVDGESLLLEPPLRFRIRPRALRVRIAHAHPGGSPSSVAPSHPLHALKALLRMAAGR